MFDESKLQAKNGMSAKVGLGDWLLVDCVGFLNLIPIIGSIAAIVIYLMLAFGSSSAASIKTRIQANLLWSVIGLVLSISLTLILVFVVGLSSIDLLNYMSSL